MSTHRFCPSLVGRATTLVALLGCSLHTWAARVVPGVTDATFTEFAGAPYGDYLEQGTDPALPESVNSAGAVTIAPFTVSWGSQAAAYSTGPRATATLQIAGGIGDVGSGGAEATTNAYIAYQVLVYNKTGTATTVDVPLRFKGYYAINQSISGEVPIWMTGAGLNANYTVPGGPFVSLHAGAGYSDDFPGPSSLAAAFDEVLSVRVDAAPLSSTTVNVNLTAIVRARVEAWMDYERNSATGAASMFAYIDPEIFIDPAWEQAEDFGLVFSANIEPFAAPVPLPASSWLLGWAFGGIALAMRGRARRAG